MLNLAVNSPEGRKSVADLRRAARALEARWPHFRYAHTPEDRMSKADAILFKDGEWHGLVLGSCRYDCDVEKMMGQYGGKAIITWDKAIIGARNARDMQVYLYFLVFIVPSNKAFIVKLFNPLLPMGQRWLVTPDGKYPDGEHTITRATCLGGLARRYNTFFDISKAIVFDVP